MSANDTVPKQPEDEKKKNESGEWGEVVAETALDGASLLLNGARTSSVLPITAPASEAVAESIVTNGVEAAATIAEAGTAAAGEAAGGVVEGVVGVVTGIFDGL